MTQSKPIHDFFKKTKPSVGDVVVAAAAVASRCSCGCTGEEDEENILNIKRG